MKIYHNKRRKYMKSIGIEKKYENLYEYMEYRKRVYKLYI